MSTGKENKITITNDKGRLSKEDIEKMVNDAEKYKAEDDKQRERVQAKNELESYAFNVKQSVEDDKLKGKLSDEDKNAVVNKAKEVLEWLGQQPDRRKGRVRAPEEGVGGSCQPDHDQVVPGRSSWRCRWNARRYARWLPRSRCPTTIRSR